MQRLDTDMRLMMCILIAWAALLMAGVALHQNLGVELPGCLFRKATGQPCATCGGTRATIHLVNGRFAEAARMNPFVTLAWFVVPLGGAWLLMRGRRGRPRLAPRVEKCLLIIAGLLLAANWAYLLTCRPF